MQVDPVKPTLKPPRFKRLRLKYDKLLSNLLEFSFRIQLATLQQDISRWNVESVIYMVGWCNSKAFESRVENLIAPSFHAGN